MVTATPSGGYTPGQQVTASWTTANQGNASTGPTGWTEQLIVTDLTTGHQIELASIVQPDATPLDPNASVARSVTFAWPTGLDSTGNFSFVVNVDTTNQITEANDAGTGKTNNRSELDVLSAPDLTVTGLQATNAAQAGGPLTLQWTDTNTGTVGTPAPWSDRVTIYNTTTNQTIIDTVVPANPSSGSLLPGGTLAQSVTVTLPIGLAGGGTLQVSVTANRDINNASQITEASANGNAPYNNTQQITVTSAQLPYADLTASNLTIPASGTGGGTIAVGWTVTNTGDGPTNVADWNDEVVFSPTATLDPATEIVLGTFAHSGVLSVGASYTQQQTVALPLRFNGTGYIAVLTDPTGAVAEPARAQEYITGPVPIAITAPYADLATQAVSAPGTANAGSTISVSWRVANLGDAATSPAGGWTDQIYLALTDTVTPSSILLGTVPHSTGLAVGSSYTSTANLVVPSGLSGAYHVLVVTNANNADFESGLTANDTAEAPGALLINAQPSADLAVTALSIPATTVPGVPTPVTFTVQNIGQTVARGPWTDQLVLLYGPALANSVPLTSIQRTGDLQVGDSYTVTANVTLPSLPDQTVEIAAQTDSGGAVQESGRTANNTLDSAAFATTHPDLVPAQVQAPAAIVSGQPLTVSWTDMNTGTGPVLPVWTDTVTLVQGNTSLVIGTIVQTTPLAAGASLARSITYTLPISVSGAYTIVVTADSGNAVTEVPAQKTDNTASVPLSIALAPYADLAVSNVTAPATTIADPATVTIGWTVTNHGTGAGITSSWTDQIVLSASGVLGASDNIVLGSYVHTGALDVGASYDNSQTVTLPPGFNGRYQLFVVTNTAGTVFENGSTANNVAQLATPFDVIPYAYAKDIVTSVTLAANPASGQIADVTWVVQNQGIGTTDTSEWVDTVYLSTTPDGANKVLLGQYDHLGFLAVDQSYTRTAEVQLPNGISGPYYFIVATAASSTPNFNTAVPSVVAQGSVGSPYEFVYANTNTGVSAVTNITLTPAPDLVVTSVTAPTNAEEGTAISVSWNVTNEGQGPADGSWTDNVLLQAVGDSNPGTLVGTFTFTGPLIAGQFYTRTAQIVVPLHMTGLYNVIIVPNANSALYEGAGNNTGQGESTAPLNVSAQPRPDLVVSSITAPATINAGAAASVSFEVTNVGTLGTGSAQWTDSVYLSLSSTIDSSSILIGTLPAGSALTPGMSYSTDAGSFVVPLRYAGNAYIIVQTNSNTAVDEYPHGNNDITVQQIYVNPAPLADLVVSNVAAPALAFPNNQVTVNFTVTNQGAGPTNLGTYAEQIWLTTDKQRPNPGKGDILLTEVQYNGGILAAGAGYDQSITVTLPSNLVSGTYYLTAWVDPYETLIQSELATNINPDDPNEIQNDNYKAGNSTTGGTEIIGLPPAAAAPLPDVSVVALSADPTGQATQNFTFSWTVTNTGPGVAATNGNAPWQDTVYLADAPTLAAATNVWTLGVYAALGPLANGQSYTDTQTVLLNPAARGTYVIVVTSLAGNTNTTSSISATVPTNVTGGVPDLQVTHVSVPPTINSGDSLTVSYTVLNNSATPIWTGTGYWSDFIYLSRDPTFIASRATLLGTVAHANTGLDAQGSYTDSLTATVPQGIGGTFYVYVFVNRDFRGNAIALATSGQNALSLQGYGATAYEDPANNSGSAVLPIVYAEPELVVSNFTVPADAVAGSTVSVTYTVTNIGNRATRQSSWTDAVFLSTDASLDNGDYLLTLQQPDGSLVSASSVHKGVLAAGASYTTTVTFTVPFEVSGPFYLLAATDTGYGTSGNSQSTISTRLNGVAGQATGNVPLYAGAGHNVTAQQINVTPYTAPDLVVSTIDAPQMVTIGSVFSVSYTVTNQGGDTPLAQSAWNDLVYLSVEPYLDLTTDRYIGSYQHTGGLTAGSSYSNTLTFQVPNNLPGNAYYVFVVTDPALTTSTGAVFESNETNNSTHTTVPMIIDTPPPTDLQVDSVTVPATASAGDPITVSYTVSDHSDVPASGTWTDAVYISASATWDITARLLGYVTYSGTLQQNGSYTQTLTSTIPGLAPGDYHVLVRTNIYNSVYEGQFASNNTTASASTIRVAVDTLTIGDPLSTTLLPGQERLYQVQVPEGETLRVTLTAANGQSINTLYIRYNAAPTTALYDATYSGGVASDLTALIPSTQPGTYYILVQGFSGPSTGTAITLLAEELPLVITGIDTAVGGAGAYVTTTISGAQFSSAATVQLSRPGLAEYTPVSYQVVNSTQIIAVFDFTGAPLGSYDLIVTNPDGSQAITPYDFLIQQVVQPQVTIGIGGNRTILAGDAQDYSIQLDNLGNLDAPYTFFQVGVPQLGTNYVVYGLPYLTFSSDVSGQPSNLASSANANVPYSAITGITNTNGQLITSGFLLNAAAGSSSGFTVNVQTYPGLEALNARAFSSFAATLDKIAPSLAPLLANGASGLNDWWTAFKALVSNGNPQLQGVLDQLDFVDPVQCRCRDPQRRRHPVHPIPLQHFRRRNDADDGRIHHLHDQPGVEPAQQHPGRRGHRERPASRPAGAGRGPDTLRQSGIGGLGIRRHPPAGKRRPAHQHAGGHSKPHFRADQRNPIWPRWHLHSVHRRPADLLRQFDHAVWQRSVDHGGAVRLGRSGRGRL